MIKKVQFQAYDQDKMTKLCKDQKLDPEETRCFLAILEFILVNASKQDISDTVLGKDLLQLGVAVENSNQIQKSYNENQESLVKA